MYDRSAWLLGKQLATFSLFTIVSIVIHEARRNKHGYRSDTGLGAKLFCSEKHLWFCTHGFPCFPKHFASSHDSGLLVMPSSISYNLDRLIIATANLVLTVANACGCSVPSLTVNMPYPVEPVTLAESTTCLINCVAISGCSCKSCSKPGWSTMNAFQPRNRMWSTRLLKTSSLRS